MNSLNITAFFFYITNKELMNLKNFMNLVNFDANIIKKNSFFTGKVLNVSNLKRKNSTIYNQTKIYNLLTCFFSFNKKNNMFFFNGICLKKIFFEIGWIQFLLKKKKKTVLFDFFFYKELSFFFFFSCFFYLEKKWFFFFYLLNFIYFNLFFFSYNSYSLKYLM